MFPDMFEIFNQDKEEEESPVGPSSQPTHSDGKFFSISIGGSVLVEEKPNATKIAKFSESINKLLSEGYKFALVMGGGKTCRNYQAVAKSLGANNYFLDELGINVTRLNASLLTQTIDNAFPRVLTNVSKAREVVETGKIPIFGGMMPGITTDAVAALLAEQLQGDFINLSNVDGVYSKDPRKSPTAKFYPEMSYGRLISIIHVAEARPGQNIVLDLPAALILKRSKIRALFLNGDDLNNFESAVRGGEFNGTVVGDGIIEEEESPKTGKGAPGKRAKPEEEEDEGPDPNEIDF